MITTPMILAALPSTFSLTQVIVTAATSFVVSGIGGILLQRFLSRAKPSIVLQSVAFEGASGLIEIPEKTFTLVAEDAWGPSFDRFEPFDVIRSRERHVSEIEARLEIAIRLAQQWLEKLADEDDVDLVTRSQVTSNPYMTDNLVGSAIHGMIRRDEIPSAPLAMDEIEDHDQLFPLIEQDDGWHLHLGSKGVRFPNKKLLMQEQKDLMHLAAESFSRGIRANINHFTRSFLSSSKEERLRLKEIRDSLRTLLLQHARISVTTSLVNTGKSAIAIKPYFQLTLSHKHLEQKTFVLQPEDAKDTGSSDLLARLLTDKKKKQGNTVSVDPFLPSASTAPYITLPADSALKLSFVAIEELESQGQQVYEIYRTGVLECSVTGITLTGKRITSTNATFGSTISKELALELQ